MCLGCHATAADEEEWRRMPGFHVQDGLQCEKCHGPGSEYANAETMMDEIKAKANGLILPDKRSCMTCHRVKGSHQAVLALKPFDLEAAWKAIAHPVVKGRTVKDPPKGDKSSGDFRYTGVMACAACHQGPTMSYQFEKWRDGPHARAYAVLATEKARKIAEEAGIKDSPSQTPHCLYCHAPEWAYTKESFLEGADPRDGVTCESCHGPGSQYSPEAVMRDKTAARAAGLWKVDRSTCMRCHKDAHGRKFDYDQAATKISHPTRPATPAQSHSQVGHKNPLNLALTPEGNELWAACEASGSIVVVDTASRRRIAEIPAGGQPTDVTFDPGGRRAFVSNRLDDSVSVIDVRKRRVLATLEVGDEPHGVLVDKAGRYLYVLNTSSDSISLFDVETLKQVKQLSASRAPWSLAASPDGKSILVTNTLSRFVPQRTTSMSEVTVIDAERAVVDDRYTVPDANLLQGVAWHPSGEYAVITLLRTKNLVPMTRVRRGWVITNGLGIVWADGTVDQMLLDLSDSCFPDPADVAITPDGKYALVTSSTSGRIAVVDLTKAIAMLKGASEHERRHVIPNHLGKPTEYLAQFIEAADSPRGIVCSPDGRTVYVAQALDDSIGVIDLTRMEMVGRIDLGGSKEMTTARRGEKLFNSARNTFGRQFSCHSCHPDGHVDGLTYDIEPDGIGLDPVDNRTLRGINDTAPYKWTGKNPSLKRQCGPRLAVFFTRIQPFTPEELDALDYYICTIERPPNRYRKLGAPLTPAQARGRYLFERECANDGRAIPENGRCITCHPPPLYTDCQIHDVGTKGALDQHGRFDTPHLNNIYDSAPYLHDGRSPTLEEIWTRFNPYDEHGVTNDMTKDQLNDLIEYLKSL
jgi:YVTN family beta-propeller protein